ncbi:RHS repeat domain-containing protein, partial [Burkholderia sp. Bp9140]|uniref:RHS repeat domain-containing protein n=1 Tax=Burkholderia sp. Bp9140 TaxID=2184572 RepID=UPI0021AB5F25
MVREDPDDADSVPVAQRMHTFRERHHWQGASLYLHEPGTFVPLARLDETLVEAAFVATDAEGRFVQVPAKTRHATLFYQNDHLGTPQELLDESGKVVWVGRYRAWGGEKTVWRETPERNEAGNAIRFQGQYRDEETGLHYNRYRYYDPGSGRFMSKDPIDLAGGLNVWQYAPNPVQWIDPFGLAKYYRGAKAGSKPSFEPRPGEYKVRDGNVQPTHGVSVFDNPESCSCRGFVPHEVDPESVSEDLKIIQRGKDPAHFEIIPANPMAEDDYKSALGNIKVK